MADSWRVRIAKLIGGEELAAALAAVSVQVDDSPGWSSFSQRPHDRDLSEIQSLYSDALTAWRRNPIAWRIVSITSDYVVGDKLKISSPRRDLQRYIEGFWSHPKNRIELRLEAMSDELARSGDLFPVLFRNELDGMSYLRFVTKDRIVKIETAPNDWETEIAYHEQLEDGQVRVWPASGAPAAQEADACMLHYSVNRPIGALLGESDLATMLPWLQRYSRMLEDRVRLHWALRAFLWVVTVPSQKVREKMEQYRTPPESGSIIVKDESETWEAMTPALRGADASHDMSAVRQMIDAGSGYPPHWRGEAADANLATATAMQAPTERHLLRRQKYFSFILQDLIYQGYRRAAEIGKYRRINEAIYEKLFTVDAPDVSRADNESLAKASRDLAETFRVVAGDLALKDRPTLAKLAYRMVFKFAGEPQSEETIEELLTEAATAS